MIGLVAGLVLAFIGLGVLVALWALSGRPGRDFDDEPTLVRPVPSIVNRGTIVGRVRENVSAGQLVALEMPPINTAGLEGVAATAAPERGWMQTFSGRKFFPLNPRVEDVELADVAHGLAMTCRYGGQARRFYSVAEHCVLVSEYVMILGRDLGMHPDEIVRLGREALLHDSAEAYIGDMIRPLKHQPEMLEFRKAEAAIEAAIFERFGIVSTHETHALIKQIDNKILVDEIRTYMPDPTMYLNESHRLASDLQLVDEALGVHFYGWLPAQAELGFMARYHELFA